MEQRVICLNIIYSYPEAAVNYASSFIHRMSYECLPKIPLFPPEFFPVMFNVFNRVAIY